MVRRILASQQAGLVLVIVFLGIILAAFAGSHPDRATGGLVNDFLNSYTLIQTATDASFFAVMAVGATMVIISGGIDLSVGSVLLAGSMVSAALAQDGRGPVLAVLAGIAVGAAVGLLNGVLINYLRISAIIVTLGTLFAVRAIVSWRSGGNPIAPLPDSFTAIGQAEVAGVPLLIGYALVIGLLAHVLLNHTPFGWAARATGGNRTAAHNVGIDVRRLSTIVYVLSGAAAGLAGVLMSARLGSGSPSVGAGFELQAIAAAIIGGASIAGAIGTIPGAMLGALLLSVLGTGLVLLRVDPSLQDLVTGVVLIAAAGLDQLRRTQMFKTSARRASAVEGTQAGGGR
jgi:ribose transport system permease protein